LRARGDVSGRGRFPRGRRVLHDSGVRGARVRSRPPRAPRRRREPGGAQAARLGGGRLQEAARAVPGPGRAHRRRAPGPERDRTVKGYGGRVLAVDLASGATRIESLAERTARRLLGGNGLAARLLYDRVPPGTDPFAPANAVVFSVGPITDTTVPGNSRACASRRWHITGRTARASRGVAALAPCSAPSSSRLSS